MVRRYFTNNFLLRKKIYEFISSIQIRNLPTKPSLETLKITRGLAALFVSLILAWSSHQLTSQKSIQNYEKSHWPPSWLWQKTLQAQGLTLRSELGAYSKLLGSHPQAFSDEKTIWISDHLCVVYLPASPYHPGAELWTCATGIENATWGNLGSGIKGFEKLIDFFEKNPIKIKQSTPKAAKRIDPKEFHY